MRAKHYCAACDTHFRADVDVHAREYHDGAPFPGVEHGDFRDYRRLTGGRSSRYDTEQ